MPDIFEYNNNQIDKASEEKLRSIFSDGTAENTLRAYRSDMKYFISWCEASGIEFELPVPKEIIIQFIVDHSEGLDETVDNILVDAKAKKELGTPAITTLTRRIASISSIHQQKSLHNPCADQDIKTLLRTVKRAALNRGYRPNKKAATTADIIEQMVNTCDDTNIGIRDAALIMFAFSSGGRRSAEVSDAQLSDLYQVPEGYLYNLGTSKTIKSIEGMLQVPILGKAGRILHTWVQILNASEGPIFRAISPSGAITKNGISTKTVSNIVKKRVQLAGYDPKHFGSHSIRSGFITEGGRKNINLLQLMELSGHKSIQTAKGYYRTGNLKHNPASRLLDD